MSTYREEYLVSESGNYRDDDTQFFSSETQALNMARRLKENGSSPEVLLRWEDTETGEVGSEVIFGA